MCAYESAIFGNNCVSLQSVVEIGQRILNWKIWEDPAMAKMVVEI